MENGHCNTLPLLSAGGPCDNGKMDPRVAEIAQRIVELAKLNPAGARLQALVEGELWRLARLDNFVVISARQAVAGIREARAWLEIGEARYAMSLFVAAAMRVGFALTVRPRSAALKLLRANLERTALKFTPESQGAAA
jgi:hypothetical protein